MQGSGDGNAVAQPEILEQQVRSDARAVINDGQARTRMRSAAYEINIVHVLQAVVRPEIQELVERMGDVEGGAAMDGHVGAPIVGRDDLLITDAPTQARN